MSASNSSASSQSQLSRGVEKMSDGCDLFQRWTWKLFERVWRAQEEPGSGTLAGPSRAQNEAGVLVCGRDGHLASWVCGPELLSAALTDPESGVAGGEVVGLVWETREVT